MLRTLVSDVIVRRTRNTPYELMLYGLRHGKPNESEPGGLDQLGLVQIRRAAHRLLTGNQPPAKFVVYIGGDLPRHITSAEILAQYLEAGTPVPVLLESVAKMRDPFAVDFTAPALEALVRDMRRRAATSHTTHFVVVTSEHLLVPICHVRETNYGGLYPLQVYSPSEAAPTRVTYPEAR